MKNHERAFSFIEILIASLIIIISILSLIAHQERLIFKLKKQLTQEKIQQQQRNFGRIVAAIQCCQCDAEVLSQWSKQGISRLSDYQYQINEHKNSCELTQQAGKSYLQVSSKSIHPIS